MKTEQDVIYLKDYQPHPYRISHSDIGFVLDPGRTEVTTTHQIDRREGIANETPLELDCENMEIISIEINEQKLDATRYFQSEKNLVISSVPQSCKLRIVNIIHPDKNTELSGLYKSTDMLCTQCEAEGFRRITPSIDRPDNLATYRVKLQGDRERFPIMLSNGNLEKSENSGNHQTVVWHDPFPKPTYLFAIVAGVLSEMRDTFATQSGREVSLRFYARDEDIEKCEFAMGALKRSMKWDEEVYGREYDLDLFNIVAVGDFNMGAMENKSLNIFNTKYVLADPNQATDTDFMNVERVVAHEYFHNWSGNRVTCRDWFQLSLKEGFTVFRDQEFSADMHSRGVQRIGDVNVLRNHQFPEDSGPMAHPVRPAYYQEINNFYTVTIYEKGAEVVRMLRTLVGAKPFRQGTDLYFDRHDGQAVTTDEFVKAISDASGENMDQFQNWYSQAGTPRVNVEYQYDAATKSFKIALTQSCPQTPDGEEKEPFHIPIKIALFDQTGEKLELENKSTEIIFQLKEQTEQLVINDIDIEPVPSVLREFTSPVILKQNLDNDGLKTLFLYDDDPFNRWEAGQQLLQQAILGNVKRLQNSKPCQYDRSLIDTVGSIIDKTILHLQAEDTAELDYALTAKLLTLPGQSWIAQQSKPIDPHAIATAHHELSEKIASDHYQSIMVLYKSLSAINDGSISGVQMGIRDLRDVLLSLICTLDTNETHLLAEQQLSTAKNMTDRAAAFQCIVNSSSANRGELIAAFYEEWKEHPLVLDKWLRIQATSRMPDTLDQVKALTSHNAFDPSNPNKVYALILGATHGNPIAFHQKNGDGYQFLANWILKLDSINPQIAARLASGFNQWQDMIPEIGDRMRAALIAVQEKQPLSNNVSEIVNRALV